MTYLCIGCSTYMNELPQNGGEQLGKQQRNLGPGAGVQ